ncbi:MAG: hypothetical protein LBS96_04760 [Oscillospiraceae bacterium]|jgi:hypothetical protein|nr:hypothetical protein [Oscillospiraceae bacterium]
MGLVYDLFINRECEDCEFGEFDLLEQKYWCRKLESFRDPADENACPDLEKVQT